MQITRIERASKSKPRYHLYADDALLMTVTEETLLHFRLHKGLTLSYALQEEIFAHDQLQRCLEQAYRYLSRRSHFRKELARKLTAKGYPPHVIEQALDYLDKKGYLNDHDLMFQFIHDAIRLKQYGPHLIKRKLFERGLSGDQIDAALDSAYPPDLQAATCHSLALKKLKSLQNLEPSRVRQKLFAFLQQRGFNNENIQPVIENLFED
ncbi:regulatory protein RecX [Caldithrix abyssi]